MYRFGFVIEQTLGHVTHSQNLKKYVALDPAIEPAWILPAWDTAGLGARIPIYRSNWTVRAGMQARSGLASFSRERIPDVLFFHTQVTATLANDWLRRIPSVVSLDATPRQYDELGDFYSHTRSPNWLEKLKWQQNRTCFSHARHLVTWSEWAKQGLVNEYEVPAEKVTVLPPGVDFQAWDGKTPRRPSTTVKILFVGGDLERKGGLLLLQAYRYLKQNLEVDLAGQPVDVKRNEKGLKLELHLVTRTPLAPEAGVFVYDNLKPNSDQLKELFFTSDIFCLPTRGDCLPMVLSEAGAAGLPCVSTSIAAIPEIVQEGETGFLVPPDDLQALIDALQKLVLDPQLRLRQGQAARQVVRQRFDAGKNAAHLLELMKQIVGGTQTQTRML